MMDREKTDLIPRAIEVLVKKASVDPEFKTLLLEKRDEAAGEIGLALEPAEVLMLRAVPEEQLDTIIARTSVPKEHRRAFLGTAAAAMLAAIGVVVPGCGTVTVTDGIRPDRPSDEKKTKSPPESKTVSTGMSPDRPKRMTVSKGIRPKPPPPKPPSSDAEKK